MSQTKWFERKFDFTGNENSFPLILERVASAPDRLEELMKNIQPSALVVSIDNSWTIKENIGHLSDLEPLWQGRLGDILNGQPELRATDLQNRRTTEASHNTTSIHELLRHFRDLRRETVLLMESLRSEHLLMSSLHPRLKTPMRTIDHFLFVAEHDDHHLARIAELNKSIQY